MKGNGLLRRVLRFLGMDRAVVYTLLGRGWAALAGAVTLVFLVRFLSPAEQGFYYTFTSILGLQIFFELGLGYVILQFTSHEKAHLEWTSGGFLEGSAAAKSRIASLLRTALAWYGVVSVLVFAIILPVGIVFFGQHQTAVAATVQWRLPWVLVVLITAGALFTTPIFAVLQGCGRVAEVALMRLGQAVVGSLAFWLVLSGGGGLMAAPALSAMGLLWGAGWLLLRERPFLQDLLQRRAETASIHWKLEIWPLQWKIALSWLSGYFIFQLFNPILFAFSGAVAAGRMGMSISVMTTIWAMAMAWIETKAAPFGSLIAKREYKALDRMFFTSLWQAISVVLLGGIAFWSAAFYLNSIQHSLAGRLLSPLPLGLLIGAMAINLVVGAEAIYLRAHKQEPFLWLSLAIGCLTGLSAYFLGRSSGALGMMAGYFAVNLVVGLGMGTFIFLQKRRLWHQQEYSATLAPPGAEVETRAPLTAET